MTDIREVEIRELERLMDVCMVPSVQKLLRSEISKRKDDSFMTPAASTTSRLPDEVLENILSFFCGTCKSIRIASLVCHSWNAVAATRWEGVCRIVLPFFSWDRSLLRGDVRGDFLVPCPSESFFEKGVVFEKISDWKLAMQQVLRGERVCIAQVLDKHNAKGTMMSAYDALITCTRPASPSRPTRLWDAFFFIHREPGAAPRQVFEPDRGVTEDRLRRVPADIEDCNPYQVILPRGLATSPKLVKDAEVEIQFRFRAGDCFGWWRGFVDSVTPLMDEPGTPTQVVVRFPQYDETSKWYRETLLLGLEKLKAGNQNQSSAGLRLTTSQEGRAWRVRWDHWQEGGASESM